MKIKPADKQGGVIVELGPKETQLATAPSPPRNLPAFKLRKILIPVDFSSCTSKAIAYAVPFARQFNAALTLLHVIEPTFSPPSELLAMPEPQVESEAKADLDELRRQIPKNLHCEKLVRRGAADREIVDAANELESDLIILSTHGRTGLGRVLMGSTAEKVVRHAGCPVLVVRTHEHEFIAETPAQPTLGTD